MVADGAAHVAKKSAFDVHSQSGHHVTLVLDAQAPSHELAGRVRGLRGRARLRLAALFAFGRAGRRAGDPAAGAPPELIALTSVEVSVASNDPLAAAIPVDVTPPARAWDAPEADRDSLVPLTAGPSDSDGRRHLAPAPDQGENGGRLRR